jgi:hypothetical protein
MKLFEVSDFGARLAVKLDEHIVDALKMLQATYSTKGGSVPDVSDEDVAKALAGLIVEYRRVSVDKNLGRNLLDRATLGDTIRMGLQAYQGAAHRQEAEMLAKSFMRDMQQLKVRGVSELADRIGELKDMYAAIAPLHEPEPATAE